MIGRQGDPIYGATSAIKTVAIRAVYLLNAGGATGMAREDMLKRHIRGMEPQAFQIIWESHVIEILGNLALAISDNDPEAREIFLIALEQYLAHQVQW